jgi:hypothetical protein
MATSKAEIEEMNKSLERELVRMKARVKNLKPVDITNVKLTSCPPAKKTTLSHPVKF